MDLVHYIQLNNEADTLVWDGNIPKNELCVKIGGGHGSVRHIFFRTCDYDVPFWSRVPLERKVVN